MKRGIIKKLRLQVFSASNIPFKNFIMNMRYLIILSVFLALAMSSCEDLDQEVRTTLSEDQIYRSFSRTKSHLNGVYVSMPSGFLEVSGAMMASASDEAEHTEEISGIHKFNVGSWGPYDNPDKAWNDLFQGVRRANAFLAMSDSIDWSTYLQNPTPENKAIYEKNLAESKRWKYEARFLRAYFYFELVKRYGGVPLFTEALSYDADLTSVARNTLSECFTFIVNESDSAAANLPLVYPLAEDLGRATRAAALALKSRALLYKASELFNNTTWAGGYGNTELISVTGDRAAAWKAAADAAKAVIDLTGLALDNNYKGLFQTFTSSEILFIRRGPSSNNFEIANYPIGYDMGRSGTTPTQDLVDAYEMLNGKAISDPTSGYDPQNPYANRDPRLAFSVVTNGSNFKDRPVEIWEGGRDGKGVPLASRTGYYLRKYVDEGLNLLLNNKSVHSWHIFRLAEIYLNYAEALNEYDPSNADIKIYVDKVRQRTGVKMPVLPAGLTQEEMRQRIRNERRVELAFEDHRLWDLRRWMVATDYLNKPVKGMSIKQTAPGTYQYQVVDVENRVFVPKMYLYPIPQSELNVSKSWAQNPLW